jgi:hypothetical protein
MKLAWQLVMVTGLTVFAWTSVELYRWYNGSPVLVPGQSVVTGDVWRVSLVGEGESAFSPFTLCALEKGAVLTFYKVHQTASFSEALLARWYADEDDLVLAKAEQPANLIANDATCPQTAVVLARKYLFLFEMDREKEDETKRQQARELLREAQTMESQVKAEGEGR